MSDIERQAAVDLIARHIDEHGDGDWRLVRAVLPEMSDSTFWRYVRRARAGHAGAPSAAQARRRLAADVAANCPTQGAGMRTKLRAADLSGQIDRLFADVDMLRAYAVREGSIRNPMFFTQSITLRERVVSTTVRCRQAMIYEEEATAFYEALVDEVAAEAPDAAQRIIRRLAAVQSGSVSSGLDDA